VTRKGKQNGKAKPHHQSRRTVHDDPVDSTPSTNGFAHIVCVSAADIKLRKVAWIVPGYLPSACITILEGRKGSGKSLVAASWAVMAQQSQTTSPRCVIWSTLEESLAAQTVPRLRAAEADLSRVLFPGADAGANLVSEPLILPHSLRRLTELVRLYQPVMLVLDPLSSHCSSEYNLNSEQSARAILDPLAQLATSHELAILLIRHWRKGPGHSCDRGLGSAAISAAARSVVAVTLKDRGERTGVIRSVACNLSSHFHARAFSVDFQHGYDAPRIVWNERLDETDSRLQEELVEPSDQDALADAQRFLAAELAEGPAAVAGLQSRAEAAAISRATLRRAKHSLGIISVPEGARESRIWYWQLPDFSLNSKKPGA
jgi:putative DNA primase/helicase